MHRRLPPTREPAPAGLRRRRRRRRQRLGHVRRQRRAGRRPEDPGGSRTRPAAADRAAAAAAGWRWEWCGTGEQPAEPGSGAGRARGRGHSRPAYAPPPIFGRLCQDARRRGVRPGSVESAGLQFLSSLSSHARARARTRDCTALGVFNITGCLRHVAAARGQSR